MNSLLALIFLSLSLTCLATETGDVETQLIQRFVPEEAREFIKKVTYKMLEAPHDVSLAKDRILLNELCGNGLLPTTKAQTKKSYHAELTVVFDRMIPGDSPLCHVRQRGGRLRCILAKRIKIKLLSDIYKDSCDKVLRGFSWVTYTIPGEKMSDSVSPGRSLEIVDRFNGAALYRPGPIAEVSLERFEFFEAAGRP